MPRVCLTVLLLLSLQCQLSASEYYFDYTDGCGKAYQAYMSLNMAEGNAALIAEIRKNPYNLMPTYIADYEDCLVLMLNANRDDYERVKSHFEERLELLEKGNPNSPWYRFAKSGLYMHWALIHFRMGDQLKAALMFRKSYILIKENSRLFPTFEYNKIFLSLQETIAGTIPDNYKWIAAVFGLKGNVKRGGALIVNFIENHKLNDPLYNEAAIYYVYLGYFLLSKQYDVWKFVNSSQFPTQHNLLNTFVKSNIAVNYRKAEACVQTIRLEEKNKDYYKYPVLDYMLGNALYNKVDPSCIFYLQRFLKNYKGKTYRKDTWQRIALSEYLQKNMTQANYAREQLRTDGSTQIDADRQAERFGESNEWPNRLLLRVRLMIDAGLSENALMELKTVNERSFLTTTDQLEYYFRSGRAFEETGNTIEALKYYQTTINKGMQREDHFAARAALQMGFIYEHSGRKKEALAHYQEALGMRHHDFQASIDQQAKAGINRLTEQ